jgi:hypothetical protein
MGGSITPGASTMTMAVPPRGTSGYIADQVISYVPGGGGAMMKLYPSDTA